jgi:hypothetical protein
VIAPFGRNSAGYYEMCLGEWHNLRATWFLKQHLAVKPWLLFFLLNFTPRVPFHIFITKK